MRFKAQVVDGFLGDFLPWDRNLMKNGGKTGVETVKKKVLRQVYEHLPETGVHTGEHLPENRVHPVCVSTV